MFRKAFWKLVLAIFCVGGIFFFYMSYTGKQFSIKAKVSDYMEEKFYQKMSDTFGMELEQVLSFVDEEDREKIRKEFDNFSLEETMQFFVTISDGDKFYQLISGEVSPENEDELGRILQKYESMLKETEEGLQETEESTCEEMKEEPDNGASDNKEEKE